MTFFCLRPFVNPGPAFLSHAHKNSKYSLNDTFFHSKNGDGCYCKGSSPCFDFTEYLTHVSTTFQDIFSMHVHGQYGQ